MSLRVGGGVVSGGLVLEFGSALFFFLGLKVLTPTLPMFRQDVCPSEKQSVQSMLAARQLQRMVRQDEVLVHWQHDSRGCPDLFAFGVGLGGG